MDVCTASLYLVWQAEGEQKHAEEHRFGADIILYNHCTWFLCTNVDNHNYHGDSFVSCEGKVLGVA